MLRPWHYSLVLDKTSPHSIHQQLTHHFRSMIEGGNWLGGSPLPSSRDIAQQLGINRKTVSRVYEELSAQGLIFTQPKRGTFVVEKPVSHSPGPVIHSTSTELEHRVNNIHQLIHKSCVHHIRRAALHMHRLKPQDYDVTGLHPLKHILATLLAHERRYLIPPAHIACGTLPTLHAAIVNLLAQTEGYVLADTSLPNSVLTALAERDVKVLTLDISANKNQMSILIEQIEKFCINYPVKALWCNSEALCTAGQLQGDLPLLTQKLTDYNLLLIDDQHQQLAHAALDMPLAARHPKSLYLGSLYGDFCDTFNVHYVCSTAGWPAGFLEGMSMQQQQPMLLNMLAQSELIKRGEYKKLLAATHRYMQQASQTASMEAS